MKYARVTVRVLIVVVIALSLDGCLERDPYVRLPHGYSIVAVSPRSPCFLQYKPWDDDRTYSEWRGQHYLDVPDETGTRRHIYALTNEETGETLEFKGEEAWQAACRNRNAQPFAFETGDFTDIRGFRRFGSFVVGNHASGYFILDTGKNGIENFASSEEWSRRAAAVAGMKTDGLVNPKSWFARTRHPFVYAAVGVFVLIALPWALRPLRAARHRRLDEAVESPDS